MNSENFIKSPQIQQAAKWIEVGIAISSERVVENEAHWLAKNQNNTFEACANGYLLIGKIGDVDKAYNLLQKELPALKSFQGYRNAIALLTGIDEIAVEKISNAHYKYHLKATQIAQDLNTNPQQFLTTY
jgi:hypothetical protein